MPILDIQRNLCSSESSFTFPSISNEHTAALFESPFSYQIESVIEPNRFSSLSLIDKFGYKLSTQQSNMTVKPLEVGFLNNKKHRFGSIACIVSGFIGSKCQNYRSEPGSKTKSNQYPRRPRGPRNNQGELSNTSNNNNCYYSKSPNNSPGCKSSCGPLRNNQEVGKLDSTGTNNNSYYSAPKNSPSMSSCNLGACNKPEEMQTKRAKNRKPRKAKRKLPVIKQEKEMETKMQQNNNNCTLLHDGSSADSPQVISSSQGEHMSEQSVDSSSVEEDGYDCFSKLELPNVGPGPSENGEHRPYASSSCSEDFEDLMQDISHVKNNASLSEDSSFSIIDEEDSTTDFEIESNKETDQNSDCDSEEEEEPPLKPEVPQCSNAFISFILGHGNDTTDDEESDNESWGDDESDSEDQWELMQEEFNCKIYSIPQTPKTVVQRSPSSDETDSAGSSEFPNCSVRQRTKEELELINSTWSKSIEEAQISKANNDKRVQFSDEEPEVFLVDGEECRRGLWVVDRQRFQDRIDSVGKVLAPVFDAQHRSQIYEQRFKDRVEE